MYIEVPGNDEKIVISKEKKIKEKLPPYNLVGNGLSNRHGTSVDIIDICVQLNLGEMRLLQFFRNEFNVACINKETNPNIVMPAKSAEINDYLKTALRKNYDHLEYVGLIIRLKRGTYILNPYLFMYSTGYGVIQKQWHEAAEGIQNDEV